jgi:hypothetical protein
MEAIKLLVCNIGKLLDDPFRLVHIPTVSSHLLILNFVATKIIFTNGSQDPWRHASKQTSSPDLPSYIMTCHNCGHGSDLRGCPQSAMVIEGDAQNCSSPDAVNKVRQHMIKHIDLWLSECRG